MDVYEEACAQYIDDLYRIAYIALGDADEAAQIVETVCKAGVRTCRGCQNAPEIRIRLVGDLYRRCADRLPAAASASLPEPLRALSAADRLVLILRTLSGLSDTELSVLTDN